MSARTPYSARLRLDAHKARALQRPVERAPAPARMALAMDQGNGSSATPIVRPGEKVFVGTTLARSDDMRCAPVHSPIAGRVVEIDRQALAEGDGLCVIIENDGSDEPDPRRSPIADFSSQAPDALRAHLHEGGIVGLGGAAFPTASKLSAARMQQARQLILNGAECEPWISCDDVLMRERAGEVLLGAQALMHVAGLERCTIAVEDDKPEAIESLRSALAASADERIELLILPTLYPSGAEEQLITALTGNEVPSGGLPADVGVLCQNVATAAAVARLLKTGEPLVSRIVTLTGSGVADAGNLEARIGTPIASLIDSCGGYCGEPQRLIAGGSLMGRALASDGIPLTKAMSCVIVACEGDFQPRGSAMTCIRCGDCAQACPIGLLPQSLHRATLAGDLDRLESLGVTDCILCGCCDYVCPSQIALTAAFRDSRQRVRQKQKERVRAIESRERFERHQRRLAAEAAAERDAFEQARRRARGEAR